MSYSIQLSAFSSLRSYLAFTVACSHLLRSRMYGGGSTISSNLGVTVVKGDFWINIMVIQFKKIILSNIIKFLPLTELTILLNFKRLVIGVALDLHENKPFTKDRLV